MAENTPIPHTRPAPNTLTAAGILIGAVLGAASLWTAGNWPVLLGTAALITGLAASLSNPPPAIIMATGATSLLTATLVGLIADPSWSGAVLGLVRGIIYTLCLIAPVLIIAAIRGRQAYLQRGWELALAEAREHDVRVEQAVMRERDTMASEIHDGLGHRLTLIAVQAARLSLDDTLPTTTRVELRSIRANAADASDELGETVRLLVQKTSDLTASLSGLNINDVILRARAAGLQVHSTIAEDVENLTNDYSRAALLRALQEGLTNAAKHASDTTVSVNAGIDGDDAVLRISNPNHPTNQPRAVRGHGITALRHRVQILGGALEIDRGDDFTITVRLPLKATPAPAAAGTQPSRVESVAAEDTASNTKRRRAVQLAWLVPSALLATAAVGAMGYFVYANVASVLPPERFATISTGDSRAGVQDLLPPTEMLDAPRTSLPGPHTGTCEYYEASISFFNRDDVFRICFSDNHVLTTDTIPAP